MTIATMFMFVVVVVSTILSSSAQADAATTTNTNNNNLRRGLRSSSRRRLTQPTNPECPDGQVLLTWLDSVSSEFEQFHHINPKQPMPSLDVSPYRYNGGPVGPITSFSQWPTQTLTAQINWACLELPPDSSSSPGQYWIYLLWTDPFFDCQPELASNQLNYVAAAVDGQPNTPLCLAVDRTDDNFSSSSFTISDGTCVGWDPNNPEQ